MSEPVGLSAEILFGNRVTSNRIIKEGLSLFIIDNICSNGAKILKNVELLKCKIVYPVHTGKGKEKSKPGSN